MIVLISRVSIPRAARLALYFGLGFALYKERQIQHSYFTDLIFNKVTTKVLDSKEIKKLRRAYNIKKAEAEEDKKALSKYKYDP